MDFDNSFSDVVVGCTSFLIALISKGTALINNRLCWLYTWPPMKGTCSGSVVGIREHNYISIPEKPVVLLTFINVVVLIVLSWFIFFVRKLIVLTMTCLLYTSDAADE